MVKELPGIFPWAIEGRGRLQEQKYFTQPRSSKGLISQMEEMSSPVQAFVKDCCEVGPNYQIPKEDRYSALKKWCDVRGIARQYDDAHFAMRHSTVDLTMNTYTDPKLLEVAGAVSLAPRLLPPRTTMFSESVRIRIV